ncbi:hypothetical protein GF389_01060 [Candidatus Dojkabacteria bacterium]|nr:hypothetical protein [Candidatus Dojkabacteria bacterium]
MTNVSQTGDISNSEVNISQGKGKIDKSISKPKKNGIVDVLANVELWKVIGLLIGLGLLVFLGINVLS